MNDSKPRSCSLAPHACNAFCGMRHGAAHDREQPLACLSVYWSSTCRDREVRTREVLLGRGAGALLAASSASLHPLHPSPLSRSWHWAPAARTRQRQQRPESSFSLLVMVQRYCKSCGERNVRYKTNLLCASLQRGQPTCPSEAQVLSAFAACYRAVITSCACTPNAWCLSRQEKHGAGHGVWPQARSVPLHPLVKRRTERSDTADASCGSNQPTSACAGRAAVLRLRLECSAAFAYIADSEAKTGQVRRTGSHQGHAPR